MYPLRKGVSQFFASGAAASCRKAHLDAVINKPDQFVHNRFGRRTEPGFTRIVRDDRPIIIERETDKARAPQTKQPLSPNGTK